MSKLFYLYLAGVIFWLGLWIATGWLIVRSRQTAAMLDRIEGNSPEPEKAEESDASIPTSSDS